MGTVTLSVDERATLAAAAKIRSRENKSRRMKVAAARKPGGKANRGRERDPGFCAYIRRQPCEAAHLSPCSGPIQHAHISYRVAGIANSFGRSVKNHDRHGNPLCAGHHSQQHAMGNERAFWALVGKDAYETAAAHFAAYLGDAK